MEIYFKTSEPDEPYYLLRAFDLGRIKEIIRQLKNNALDLTDVDEANELANRIIEDANRIAFILKKKEEEDGII
jgi:hypothetical protein